jgi:hypothetical protein
MHCGHQSGFIARNYDLNESPAVIRGCRGEDAGVWLLPIDRLSAWLLLL